MTNREKFCLKWNEFQANISTTFESMRNDAFFTDVTLACEDGQQVEAHKFILAASSPFFQNLLRINKHVHPLIYMRGMKSEDLLAIVDFLYLGEAKVYQENLDNFLAIAEELKLKGLSNKETKEEYISPQLNSALKESSNGKTSREIVKEVKFKNESDLLNFQDQNELSKMSVALPMPIYSGESKDLDSQIKSMMAPGSKMMANGKKAESACQVCGKEGQHHSIKDHIELHHIDGVSHPCNICDRTFRSISSLKMHNIQNHK